MSSHRTPKKSRVYIAWSKAAGPCGHEHDSIAAASRCARRFNKSIRHELTKVRDMLDWQRDVRRLVQGRIVALDTEEDFEQQRAAVERVTAPLWAMLDQSDEAARRKPVFARPGSEVFHWESCRHVAGRMPDTSVRLENAAAGLRAGMRPCSVCQPIIVGGNE